ncbi:ABC transporter ATP-binding protein [Planotetraspora silvatica]|uniref:ABC transporter ATP-binding protein n=1 Tax=Planotetraspora silvatica TaxID=234614 RepID=A0A8J3UNB6_9ACTN|nr:ATP-binding cassette domain-containing protein [Planotetraspora silvatica]GII49104.1 ABC transporter ATP-binding protein [Planotetraspora silvatica]
MTTIEVQDLTKTYRTTTAVSRLSFTVRPGRVTGFLGPNGAGKSTTMRMILNLDHPTNGSIRINGRPYTQLRDPLRAIGALLDAKAAHGGRSAHNHLLCLAQSNGISAKRVGQVLDQVGLASVATRRIGGFSLGMGQRLGIAAAMLGDPPVLMFDEPVNGLDPEGIMWIRGFMRAMAAEGRTVFVSSHLMSEMALTADHLIVIGKGRLIKDAGMAEFVGGGTESYVRVRSPEPAELASLLTDRGAEVSSVDDHLRVRKMPAAMIGDLAAARGIPLHELVAQETSLEAAYMAMTKDSVEYHLGTPIVSERK